jgi:choline kinase
MKAIILAAGMGTRLGEYTANRPKGMVEFMGKPLIEHQLNVLRRAGIADIVIVRGYCADKINYPNVRYYQNDRYAETNMVETLFCAVEEMQGRVIVLYSDILYETNIITAVMKSNMHIGVVIDLDFKEYWVARAGSITSDSESLCLDVHKQITEIGAPSPSCEKMHGRYVGILSFSETGIEAMKRVYVEERDRNMQLNKAWYHSKSFASGYMTDMLQCLIDKGESVQAIEISKGWLEIDTVEDLKRYEEWHASGTLSRFIDMSGIVT